MKLRKILDWRETLRNSGFRHLRATALLLFLMTGIAWCLAVADRNPIHLIEDISEYYGAEDDLFNQSFNEYIDGIVNGTNDTPLAYRPMVAYLIAGLHDTFQWVSRVNIDFFLKVVILVGCQLSFYRYMRGFMSEQLALAGVLLLDTYIGFALSYHVAPTALETQDLLNVWLECIVLNCIRTNRFRAVLGVFFVSVLNRETLFFLLPLFIVQDKMNRRSRWRSVAVLAALALPYVGLRLVMDVPESGAPWFTFGGLPWNVPFLESPKMTHLAAKANLRLLFLLGPLLVIGAYRFRTRPPLLRLAYLSTFLFILIHYLIGQIVETRIWMPVFPLLIPLCILNLANLLPVHEGQMLDKDGLAGGP